VIDASVAVKWVFPDPMVEPHADRALGILDAVRQGRIDVIQPAHWLPETIAVVVRLNPDIVQRATGLFDALELKVCDEHSVLLRAARLAVDLDHHLFGTLYNAVALEREATLITADERYVRKAGPRGRLALLGDFALESRSD
jgi:predicted nucleic acid-binding protein